MGYCAPGADGQDLVLQSGASAAFLSGTAHGYEVSSPVRDDEIVAATITGNSGDLAWILYSSVPGLGTSSPSYDGELLVSAPLGVYFAGAIPSSGMLAVSGPAPTLGPGVESSVIYSQAVVRGATTGRFRVASPSALVIVDDSF